MSTCSECKARCWPDDPASFMWVRSRYHPPLCRHCEARSAEIFTILPTPNEKVFNFHVSIKKTVTPKPKQIITAQRKKGGIEVA